MSKLECRCGTLIIGPGEPTACRAEFFADLDRERLWESAAGAIGSILEGGAGSRDRAARFFGHPIPDRATAEDLAFHLLARISGSLRREALECAGCGRVWLQAAAGENRYLSYLPEGSERGVLGRRAR